MNFTGLLHQAMVRIIGQSAAEGVSAVCGAVWSVGCMVGVPAIGVMSLGLFVESPTVTEIKSPPTQIPTLAVTPSNPVFVSSPVTLGPKITKALYTAYIANTQGEIVYRYPSMYIDTVDGRIEAGDLSFKVPPSIEPGSYYIRAEIVYPINAVKNGDLKMELARLIIKE